MNNTELLWLHFINSYSPAVWVKHSLLMELSGVELGCCGATGSGLSFILLIPKED